MTESENSPLSEVGPEQPEGLSGGHPEPVMPVPLPAAPPAVPIGGSERLAALDLLRGFALCGILLMNFVNFAWPGGAYTNPNHPFFRPSEIVFPVGLCKKLRHKIASVFRRESDWDCASDDFIWIGGTLRNRFFEYSGITRSVVVKGRRKTEE